MTIAIANGQTMKRRLLPGWVPFIVQQANLPALRAEASQDGGKPAGE